MNRGCDKWRSYTDYNNRVSMRIKALQKAKSVIIEEFPPNISDGILKEIFERIDLLEEAKAKTQVEIHKQEVQIAISNLDRIVSHKGSEYRFYKRSRLEEEISKQERAELEMAEAENSSKHPTTLEDALERDKEFLKSAKIPDQVLEEKNTDLLSLEEMRKVETEFIGRPIKECEGQ
jgi:hypothetical protein